MCFRFRKNATLNSDDASPFRLCHVPETIASATKFVNKYWENKYTYTGEKHKTNKLSKLSSVETNFNDCHDEKARLLPPPYHEWQEFHFINEPMFGFEPVSDEEFQESYLDIVSSIEGGKLDLQQQMQMSGWEEIEDTDMGREPTTKLKVTQSPLNIPEGTEGLKSLRDFEERIGACDDRAAKLQEIASSLVMEDWKNLDEDLQMETTLEDAKRQLEEAKKSLLTTMERLNKELTK